MGPEVPPKLRKACSKVPSILNALFKSPKILFIENNEHCL